MGNQRIVHSEEAQDLFRCLDRLREVYTWIIDPQTYDEKIGLIALILDAIQAVREKMEINRINGRINTTQLNYHMNDINDVESKVLQAIKNEEIDREGLLRWHE